ncbi:MAG: hypothetical protein ACQEQC_00850 [Elusimicrobiota bacterium]
MNKTDQKFSIGIDEAGMGPVFGPLVVSGVLIKTEDEPALKKLGVKDSKKFGSGTRAHQKRENVWNQVHGNKQIIKHHHVKIPAREIDRNNMYDLHVGAVVEILDELNWKEVENVYIEQLGAMKRENFLKKLGFWHHGFVYEPKADIKFPPVSLASIKAKLERDYRVKELCEKAGYEYVSGYANKVTEKFLRTYYKKNYSLPEGTRISRNWAPIEEMRL